MSDYTREPVAWGPLFAPDKPRNSHPTHRMHAHSLASFRELDLGARERQVCEALERIGRPASDKEVMAAMGATDPNVCRPQISRGIKDGWLRQTGTTYDAGSKRNVRVVWFAEQPRQ